MTLYLSFVQQKNTSRKIFSTRRHLCKTEHDTPCKSFMKGWPAKAKKNNRKPFYNETEQTANNNSRPALEPQLTFVTLFINSSFLGLTMLYKTKHCKGGRRVHGSPNDKWFRSHIFNRVTLPTFYPIHTCGILLWMTFKIILINLNWIVCLRDISKVETFVSHLAGFFICFLL